MAVRIRGFEYSDLETILAFKRDSMELNFPDGDFNEDIFRNALMRTYETFPGSIRVAEKDGKILGYIWFRVLNTTTGVFGRVEHIFVDEKARGNGIGKLLMKAAEDYFRKSGVKKAKLTVTKSNKAARSLYKELGYVTARYVMEKHL